MPQSTAPPAQPPTSDGYLVPKRQAWFAFWMAFALMLFDYIDRAVVIAMFPYLKADWKLTDAQLGGLVSAVSVFIAVAAFPIAILADRWSRVKAMAAMAIVWSLATIACAFSRTYAQLWVARAVVGVGEAGYGAAGSALLASMFPKKRRATVLGGFSAAAAFGAVLGVVLGGAISERWGWQWAFGIVGAPGLLLALLFLLVRDYRTVPLVEREAAAQKKLTVPELLAALFRPRAAVACYVPGALSLFVVSTIYTWLPSFLHRFYGLPGNKAATQGAIVLVLGSIGIFVWGYVSDRAGAGDPRWKLRTPALTMIASTALLSGAFALLPPGPLQFAVVCAGGFVMTGVQAAAGATLIDVTHPGLRATVGSASAVIGNLFGMAAGSVIAGALSDRWGLQTALAVLPLLCLVAAGVLWWGSAHYAAERDAVAAAAPEVRAEG